MGADDGQPGEFVRDLNSPPCGLPHPNPSPEAEGLWNEKIMNPLVDADYFLTLANQTMWVLALAAAPILIPALLSGLILGMVQAATSIQEQTLSFVPKLIVVAVSIMIFGAMILGLLSDFTNEVFARIPDLVR